VSFRMSKALKCEWTQNAILGFQMMKRAVIDAASLKHFVPAQQITLLADASGFVIAGILNHYKFQNSQLGQPPHLTMLPC